ncbi:hypothetical protein BGZ82_007740 [Podila clonocystis]|nr:hypothetical protein BGZ82_007740 [Podila clonocystis]
MTASNKYHLGLRIYRIFLAAVALVALGLNIQHIIWFERTRKARAAKELPEELADLDPLKTYPFVKEYIALLVPDLVMLVMFLLLIIGRPRFNNQNLHSVCRVLFSLTLAFGLVYWPALLVDSQVQVSRILGESHGHSGDSHSFKDAYFCSTDNTFYADGTLHMCRARVARDMLSFIAGFLVVIELVFAGLVGEID